MVEQKYKFVFLYNLYTKYLLQAGKDVQCKVEKKVQNLGGGILSKTIMVTCDDDNDDDDSDNTVVTSPFEAMLGSRPSPQPPMSLLAPILKMMAARANARLQRQMQPKGILRRFPQPMIMPNGVAMSGPFPQQFNMPYSAGSFEGPMPFHPQMMNSGMPHAMNFPPQSHRSFSSPMPGHGNNMIHENQGPIPFFPQQPQQEEPNFRFNDEHSSQQEHFDEQNHDEPQNMLFREDFNEEEPHNYSEEPEPIFRPFPAQQPEQPEIMEHNNRPPIKIVQGFPPQIPEAIRQIVSHIMKSNNRDGQDMPVIAIKAVPESRSIDDEQGPPKSKLLLPFPFRAMRMESRGARKIEDESINSLPPFPLPRGAITASLKPLVMPEAAGRALDSPVTLPSPAEMQPLRFFPGRLVRLPVPLRTYE